jgi:hypothetical protein
MPQSQSTCGMPPRRETEFLRNLHVSHDGQFAAGNRGRARCTESDTRLSFRGWEKFSGVSFPCLSLMCIPTVLAMTHRASSSVRAQWLWPRLRAPDSQRVFSSPAARSAIRRFRYSTFMTTPPWICSASGAAPENFASVYSDAILPLIQQENVLPFA